MKQKLSSLLLLLALLLLVACTPQRGSQPATDSPVAVPNQVEPTPSSPQATATPPTGSHIEHAGITFTYDPTLLGNINIQDVPASADQGLFGSPTPAHTWFGFVPAGIQHDQSNHWALTREPQIIIFNPNDFGSFAPSDEMARANAALFQQMLAERPSTFTNEIPVLPPINAAQMIRAQVRWLDFGSGTGLRFVTEYSQDNLPLINDKLLYIYHGLTSDGLHGVTAIFPLTNTHLPGIMLTGQENETPYTETFVLEKLAAITAQVNALSASDFDPLLSQLDTLVQSITITPELLLYSGGMPEVGQAVQITAVSDNPIYTGPGDQAAPIGILLAGEAVEIFGPDETGAWLNIACPRGIGIACWVLSDTAVNEPTGFFAGDGWQDITGEYVSFRVPAGWQPTVLTPGMGSVLNEWHLGIPGLEGDQTVAFFSTPFDQLMPPDLVSESTIEIGGQPGAKWVRGGERYISYDYYTAGTAETQTAGAGSFGIHVTLPEADPDLESMMDMLAHSVSFTGQ